MPMTEKGMIHICGTSASIVGDYMINTIGSVENANERYADIVEVLLFRQK
jgi:hypothetical protein